MQNHPAILKLFLSFFIFQISRRTGSVSNSATATHHNTSREGAKRDRLMFAFAHTTPLKFALLVQRKRANVAI
jgi:hypothetical protein